MKKSKKLMAVLLIAAFVFFAGLGIAHGIETSSGKVDVDRLTLSTDENATLSVKLYRPVVATAENKAPAVILIPGGNASLEYMSDTAIELSRRGYIVVAVDPYTIGRSEVSPITAADLGAAYALSYIKELDYVDTDAIGIVGWSAGTGRASAAAIVNNEPNGVKAMFYYGAGGPIAPEIKMNWGLFEGSYDYCYGFGVNKFSEMTTNPMYTENLGVEEFEFSKWYGDPTENTGRIIYTGFAGHISALYTKVAILSCCDFMNTALAAAPNGSVSGTVYGVKEYSTGIAFVSMLVSLCCLVLLLMDTDFFAEVKFSARVPVTKKYSAMTWLVLALSVAFGGLVAKWAVFNGQAILNKTKILQIANVNGFIFWLICMAAFSVVIFVLRMFIDKSFDRAALKEHMKISASAFLKSLLLVFSAVLAMYFMVTLADQTMNISPRLFKIMANVLTGQRMYLWALYFVCYLIPMLVFGYMQTSSYFVEDKPAASGLLIAAANVIPPVLFLCYCYGMIAFKDVTAINSAAMSRAFGSMMEAAILMIPVSIITTVFYRKSKNYYIGAILNAMLFSWLAVGTDLITYIG